MKPSLLPSLINKGQLGDRQRQCAPSGAWRSPPTAHTYPAARDTSVRPPGTSSPGAGQKSQVRRVTAHADRSAAVRPPAQPHPTARAIQIHPLPFATRNPRLLRPSPGKWKEGGSVCALAFRGVKFERLRPGGCADPARKTTPCPARRRRRAECTSHPPTGHVLEGRLAMLMRTRANADSAPLPYGILLQHSSLLF